MIRYGILGFGLHAVRRLMPGFARAQNSRVTAICRRDITRARQSAAQYKIPYAFASADDVCRSREVDAIFVATPNCCHLADVLLAIECGKPVVCEKPMAMNAAECRQMVEAAERANVLLGVAQVFRFENSTARLRERIAAGQIGKPILARSEFSFQGRNQARTWLTDPQIAGGGPIADVGVHAIDALRFILDDEVLAVSSQAMHDEDSGGVEAAATLALEFARHTLGVVMVSIRADYRTPLELVGESGVLSAADGLNVEYPINLQLHRQGTLIESEVVTNYDAYARQVDAFAAAVQGRSKFPVSGKQGWQNQEILDAAYRSIKTGQIEQVRTVPRNDP